VAGLLVVTGLLKISNSTTQYVYSIIRAGKAILENAEVSKLKRFKDSVTEVWTKMYLGLYSDIYFFMYRRLGMGLEVVS
jgi:hypothetical protein